ncbi:hypothetical protein SAMN04488025_11735 [Planifilum fulgidum]|uniref:Uncharacterized protein n=1 Tax=Planifilum fulgidum TaxID=201973 RepID=A0A1I2PC60_9BACL|nr:hypothetical protein SAMN04488025_11735 [Planifilum fulgidum]
MTGALSLVRSPIRRRGIRSLRRSHPGAPFAGFEKGALRKPPTGKPGKTRRIRPPSRRMRKKPEALFGNWRPFERLGEEFLKRRSQMDPDRRKALAQNLLRRIQADGESEPDDAELLLEKIYAYLRQTRYSSIQ